MANIDKRIKDLASTATSPESDDFLAIDGNTNNTRKISAKSFTQEAPSDGKQYSRKNLGWDEIIIPVKSVSGKTGDVSLVKADVGLGSVDNTSDENKPISTATQTALDGKAALIHTHPSTDISDSTSTGRSLITASSVASVNNILWETKTGAFTAVSGGRYVASGTFSVTNPASGTDGELFQVLVASGTVTVNGVAYGASRWPVTVARVAGAWTTLANTLTENLTLNGTNSTAPNQTAASGASLLTRDLADARLSALVVDFDYATASTGATGSNGSWSYTLPANAQALDIICVSSGAGGGSGRCGAAGSNRFGGGGGASGAVAVVQSIPVSTLPSTTLTVAVGAGGAGGAAQLTSDTDGNTGSVGAITRVLSSSSVIAQAEYASSLAPGRGGTATAGTAGSGGGNSVGSFSAITGGAGASGEGASSGYFMMVPGGGSGGGGVNSSNVIGRAGFQAAGSAWGAPTSGSRPASNTDGATGIDAAINAIYPVASGGTGGNGGSSVQAGAGRAGARGGGGGGGGGGTNGQGSGAGGKGGDGFCRIIVRF